MKKNKISLIVLLAVTVAVVSLSACGSKNNNSGSAQDNSVQDSALDDFSINGIKAYSVTEYSALSMSTVNFSFSDIQAYVVEGKSELNEEEKKQIVKKHKELLDKLSKTFSSHNINADINQATGEVNLYSSVLFGGDSSELSENGKRFLKSFFSSYSSVMLDKEFDGFIAKIIVEGHTAPVGNASYEDGLPLSEERSKVVMNYCLSDECGLSDESKSILSNIMESKGLSNSFPVVDSNGKVDMEASRRETFKFIINI